MTDDLAVSIPIPIIPRTLQALDVVTIYGTNGTDVVLSEYGCDLRGKLSVDTLVRVRATLAELVVRGHLQHLDGWEFRATDRGAVAAFASTRRIDGDRRSRYRALSGEDDGMREASAAMPTAA